MRSLLIICLGLSSSFNFVYPLPFLADHGMKLIYIYIFSCIFPLKWLSFAGKTTYSTFPQKCSPLMNERHKLIFYSHNRKRDLYISINIMVSFKNILELFNTSTTKQMTKKGTQVLYFSSVSLKNKIIFSFSTLDKVDIFLNIKVISKS